MPDYQCPLSLSFMTSVTLQKSVVWHFIVVPRTLAKTTGFHMSHDAGEVLAHQHSKRQIVQLGQGFRIEVDQDCKQLRSVTASRAGHGNLNPITTPQILCNGKFPNKSWLIIWPNLSMPLVLYLIFLLELSHYFLDLIDNDPNFSIR